MFKKILWLLAFTCSLVLAETNVEPNLENAIKIDALKEKIAIIDESINDNLWFKRYGNYLTYQKLIEELSGIDAEIKKFKSAKDKASSEKYDRLLSKQGSLEKQILLLQEFKNSPFSKMVEAIEIESYPKITNLFPSFQHSRMSNKSNKIVLSIKHGLIGSIF